VGNQLKKLRTIILGLLALFAVLYYVLIVDRTTFGGEDPTFSLHDGRTYARALDGPLPVRINVEKIARSSFPRTAILAGSSWAPHPIPIYSFQVVFEDGSTLIIDTAVDEELSKALSEDTWFDPEAYGRMQSAMSQAKKIVLTHEHMDHIGGLTKHPDLQQVLDHTELTKAQLAVKARREPAEFPEGALEGYVSITYSDYYSLAPGVSLIKTPGHSPGSQMIFVELKNGADFLFVGDIAWIEENITKETGRPRLLSMVFLKEQRATTYKQLSALNDLRQAEPDLKMVIAHEEAMTTGYVDQGLMGGRFE
jgi:glyoxylase-like metal-dependent hydrolase (beta-lactamase superfamily II)